MIGVISKGQKNRKIYSSFTAVALFTFFLYLCWLQLRKTLFGPHIQNSYSTVFPRFFFVAVVLRVGNKKPGGSGA